MSAPTIDPAGSSPWMTSVDRQFIRGKHMLLYGNVYDRFLLNRAYCSMHDFLEHYFLRMRSYQVVARFDLVDGFQFPNAEMQALCLPIVQRATNTTPQTTRVNPGSEPPVGEAPAGETSGGSPTSSGRGLPGARGLGPSLGSDPPPAGQTSTPRGAPPSSGVTWQFAERQVARRDSRW